METQNIINLLNGSDNKNSKFATKKWYIIDNESKGNYSHENPIKLLTKLIESSLFYYFDACILVTGDIKYKSILIGSTDADGVNRKKEGIKIALPLKYLSNFWRFLEMPLINCKIELSLKWIENCVLTAATTATFKITDAKLYIPIVTLKTEDNTKLSKLLSEGFKRQIYWNEYKVMPEKIYAANENIRILIDLI